MRNVRDINVQAFADGFREAGLVAAVMGAVEVQDRTEYADRMDAFTALVAKAPNGSPKAIVRSRRSTTSPDS